MRKSPEKLVGPAPPREPVSRDEFPVTGKVRRKIHFLPGGRRQRASSGKALGRDPMLQFRIIAGTREHARDMLRRIEVQELVLEDDVTIEVAGFSPAEIDQILIDVDPEPVEPGPATARVGDIFIFGPHRLICGDACDPAVLTGLMAEKRARLLLTDEPYNVPIRRHVTGGAHREFVMASGEMNPDDFRAFNERWMSAAIAHVVDGGIIGTFIDWRGLSTVHAAALQLWLSPLNLIVCSKSNAGMGSVYRSPHELLPRVKKGLCAHVNNVALGRHGRRHSNVLWPYPGASSRGSDARGRLVDHPGVKPVAMLEDALRDLTNRGDIVIEPFLGSGSTLIAAEKAGRRCCGVELDPLYVDLIVRRHEEQSKRDEHHLCGKACFFGEVPGHQFFDAVLGMALEDGLQGRGQIIGRVYVGHLAGGDQ